MHGGGAMASSSMGLEAQVQQLQNMTAQAEALQGQVDVAWQASALIWRVVAATIVFIMQVCIRKGHAGHCCTKAVYCIVLSVQANRMPWMALHSATWKMRLCYRTGRAVPESCSG